MSKVDKKTDAYRLDFLERIARKSKTGISFDWVPKVEGDSAGFRFMRRHFIGGPAKTLREAVDKAIILHEGNEGELDDQS